jgi:Uma2 family endonuclease
MAAVLVDPPEDLIAERQRLGLDRFDEVWNGRYHVVPAPSDEHQRVVLELILALTPIARSIGLELRHESNLIPPGARGWSDYRVPDLVVAPPSALGELGVVGAPSLVVEVRSPGDESFEKLPFFDAVGALEVLVVDRDTKWVRRWARLDARLVEVDADADGRHVLATLPVAVAGPDDGTLRIDAGDAVHVI